MIEQRCFRSLSCCPEGAHRPEFNHRADERYPGRQQRQQDERALREEFADALIHGTRSARTGRLSEPHTSYDIRWCKIAKAFSYMNRFGYLTIRKGTAMPFLDSAFLTALAALVSSVASLVWALRRNRGKNMP